MTVLFFIILVFYFPHLDDDGGARGAGADVLAHAAQLLAPAGTWGGEGREQGGGWRVQ